MKTLSSKITIYDLAKECPQTIEIMKDLGFTEIAKPGMIKVAGRFMTLKKGCEMRKIDYEKAKLAFSEVGILFEEESL